MDIQSRVIRYYKNNNFIQKYMKGIDTRTNQIIITYNNISKNISIDDLERITSESELVSLFTPKEDIKSIDSSIEVLNQNSKPRECLNDIKILVELGNKVGIDNLLKKFAINPSTGLVDINYAIKLVTKNTMEEVETTIKNGFEFDSNLLNYDIKGNYLGVRKKSDINEDVEIMKSFNNIKLYLEAAKLYPEQVKYDDEQINKFLKAYIAKVKEELHPEDVKKEVKESTPQVAAVKNNEVNKQQNAISNAGFADIFVLSLILMVYGAIIVNLIMKLN